MKYGLESLEKRMKENIKNYSITSLLAKKPLTKYLEQISGLTKTAILLTERHGERYIQVGEGFTDPIDVVKNPGRKIKVLGRTVGHFYVKEESLLFDAICEQMEQQGEARYQQKEMALYLEELEQQLEEHFDLVYGEGEDALTGVLSASYFKKRMHAVDVSETLPVAAIVGNINDWKYVNDKFGDEESNRLIQVIAHILKEEAKSEFIIGRVDGDVFHILIPWAEEAEARQYCDRVWQRCNQFEDQILAPSIAFGVLCKTNVEEDLSTLLLDAEYEMFQNKMEIKNTKGYLERLRKGSEK